MTSLSNTLSKTDCSNEKAARAGCMVIRPESLGLSAAREAIRQIAAELELDPEQTTDILMAVGEAISNAYLHGTVDPDTDLICLSWQYSNGTLTITIKDDGEGFDVDSLISIPRPHRTLGCGISLMRASMDEVEFEYDSGSVVTLRKHLHNPAASV